MSDLSITIVVNSCLDKPYLLGEFGLSLYIEYGNKKFLFDTGAGETLLVNAANLNLNLPELDGVILSHGHREHTGGLSCLLPFKLKKIYAHPNIFEEKFARDADDFLRNVSCPVSTNTLKNNQVELCFNTDSYEIIPGLILSGEIPLTQGSEDYIPPAVFYNWTSTGLHEETLPDEQMLLINTKKGWVIVSGCGHRGIKAMLDKAKGLTGCKKFHMIIGGLHLLDANGELIKEYAKLLDQHFEKVIPLHCAGCKAIFAFASTLGEKFQLAFTGNVIEV